MNGTAKQQELDLSKAPIGKTIALIGGIIVVIAAIAAPVSMQVGVCKDVEQIDRRTTSLEAQSSARAENIKALEVKLGKVETKLEIIDYTTRDIQSMLNRLNRHLETPSDTPGGRR